MNIKITGTGSYIPDVIEKNESFQHHKFLNSDGSTINHSNEVIIEKFQAITGIRERRYANPDLNSSDMAFFAAERAIADSKIDPETLDYIIVAHNYGDVKTDSHQSDTVPSIASRVKHLLGIKNPKCVAYDILFGCPGWVEAVIQAKAFIKADMAKKCLVIGSETLSKVLDPHDRDSMIYRRVDHGGQRRGWRGFEVVFERQRRAERGDVGLELRGRLERGDTWVGTAHGPVSHLRQRVRCPILARQQRVGRGIVHAFLLRGVPRQLVPRAQRHVAEQAHGRRVMADLDVGVRTLP